MNYGKKGVKAQQKALNSRSVKWGRKIALTCVRVILIAFVGVGICGVAAGLGMFTGIIAATPRINLGDVVASGEATLVFDCEGNEIDQFVSSNANRIFVTHDQVPEDLGNAFVAIEDKRFYQHNGIDFKGILRAGYQFIKTGGEEAQGASTITQQLLKNTIFTDWTSEGNNHIKKIKRKLQEQYLALEISKYYSKEDVLLQYMNAINLGQNTLGIEAASQRYFGKSCSELTLSECAVIASITQNPSKYNPIRYPKENARRREDCLNTMLELEFIDKAEYDEAIADTEDVYNRISLHNVTLLASNSGSGSYFTDALQEQILDDLIEAGYSENLASSMVYSGGLRVYSTLDPNIQAIADAEVANPDNYPANVKWYLSYALTVTNQAGEQTNYSKENMMTWFKENVDRNFNLIFSSQEEAYEAIDTYKAAVMGETDTCDESISLTPQPQVSLTIADQSTGYVAAIIGGRGTKEGRRTLNRATGSVRQPGSTFKVLSTFAPALDSVGMTLATVFEDKPFNYEDGKPVSNWYDTGYRGIKPIREAIQWSYNVITVKALTQITPQLGYDYLLNFGFTTLTPGMEINGKIYSDVRQPLALGGITKGVTNLELNAAYAAIANGGVYIEPKLYTKVTDSDGNVILDNTAPTTRQVIKDTTAFLLTDAMVDVVTSGTGTAVNFGNMAIAGKTGTTSDNKDVWFSGYTPYYTCTTWAGYDNNVVMNKQELSTAKKLWRAIMGQVHEDLPNEQFAIPNGIVQHTVCARSGKNPIPGLCDTNPANIKVEYFADGTVPTESCDIHYMGSICAYDNLPAASADCPFQYEGVAELPLIEDESLWSGSAVIVENPDGSQSFIPTQTTNRCQHDATFFANPDYESVINAQQWELNQRNGYVPPEEDDEE